MIFTSSLHSCKKDNYKIEEKNDEKFSFLKSDLESISNSLQKDLYRDITIMNNKEDTLVVKIIFNKGMIVHEDHQKMYITYLVSNLEKIKLPEKVKFLYWIEEEETIKVDELNFSKKNINILKETFRTNSLLYDMIKYCLSNFTVESIFDLNIRIKNVNLIYPNDTFGYDFFQILEVFSKECVGLADGKNGKITVILVYVETKDYLVKDENLEGISNDSQFLLVKIIENLWELGNNGEKIQFAEQRLLGNVIELNKL